MIDQLLSRLERVKQTGPGRWIASCPTREDRSPSMTIRQLEDGRVLIHDFGGSATDEILAAVGLDWSVLNSVVKQQEVEAICGVAKVTSFKNQDIKRVPYTTAERRLP